MARLAIDPLTLVHVVRAELAIDPGHRLVAPNSLRSDALELVYALVREGGLDEREAKDLHRRLTEVKVRLLGDRVSRWTAWTIARERGWPTIGAAEYLAVATLQADALVTIDPELIERAAGVVDVLGLDALTG